MNKKTALISVFHKEGIVEFAQALVELGWNLLASGGTAKKLTEAGLPVRDVADLVGRGAILGHRVVTLSREVHAGLMAREVPEDQAELDLLGLPWIDLVCVDLYPMEEAIARPNATHESVTELTDIGGPTLLRAAAKGRRIVICDSADRMPTINWLRDGCPDNVRTRQTLAAKAEAVVANYCLASARFQSSGFYDGFIGERVRKLAYAENRRQGDAFLYKLPGADSDPLAHHQFTQIDGSPAGYINEKDLYRLTQTATHIVAGFEKNFGKVPKMFLVVKHGNIAGCAVGEDELEDVRGGVDGDPQSVFGGFAMSNFHFSGPHAHELRWHKIDKEKGEKARPMDGLIVPSIDDSARAILKRLDDRCRVFVNPALADLRLSSLDTDRIFSPVRKGLLTQGPYDFVLDLSAPYIKVFGADKVSLAELERIKHDLILGWGVGSTANSNTIDFTNCGRVYANAVGQQSRVSAALLAEFKVRLVAGDPRGCCAYSDSFAPFPDAIEVMIKAGIKAIFISYKTEKTEEKTMARLQIIADLCLAHGVVLYAAPDELVRGFFGH